MNFRYVIFTAAICAAQLIQAQTKEPVITRTHDWRFRWNVGQFVNVGRYALQFGLERDFADNKTLSGEIGLSFYRTNNTIAFERYNYKGVQGLIEYRNYFKGFDDFISKPYLAIGLFGRRLDFDADIDIAYNIDNVRDWESASHYESVITRYRTFTARVHAAAGVRLPLSNLMYFEMTGGPAFGYYQVDNGIKRPDPFVVNNFNNPFFVSSQKGSYISPAFYFSFCFGFVLAKDKQK